VWSSYQIALNRQMEWRSSSWVHRLVKSHWIRLAKRLVLLRSVSSIPLEAFSSPLQVLAAYSTVYCITLVSEDTITSAAYLFPSLYHPKSCILCITARYLWEQINHPNSKVDYHKYSKSILLEPCMLWFISFFSWLLRLLLLEIPSSSWNSAQELK